MLGPPETQVRRTLKNRARQKAGAKTPGTRRLKPRRETSEPRESLEQLVENLAMGVAIAAPSGELLYANRSFCDLLNRPAQENPVGKNLKAFVRAYGWSSMTQALSRGLIESTEGQAKIAGARGLRTVKLTFSPMDGDKPRIQVTAVDITALAESAAALKRSEDAVNLLSARLLNVQDEERRRLARDLHDTTGQEIAVGLMTLDNVSRSVKKGDPGVEQKLTEAIGWLRKVEQGIRTFSYLLHPPLLDEMGLSSALSWYVEGFAKRSGIHVELEVPNDLPRLPVATETALFRITQESLSNVLKHAQSEKAWVRVTVKDQRLHMSIRDEGSGFDQKSASEAGTLGVGIQGMRGRLAALGGSLELRSSPGGTVVEAIVSMAKTAETMAPEAGARNGEQRMPARKAAGDGKRVLIVDDHEIARQGIRSVLSGEADLRICGEAENADDAVAKARQLNPDLIILDLSMRGGGGLSAANQIRCAGLSGKILIYTSHSFAGLERMARLADCDGFVLKANGSKDLLRGVRAVLRGEEFFSTLENERNW